MELYSRFINSNFKFNQYTSCIIKRREQRSDKLQTQQHQILTFMNKIMKIHYFDRKFDCSTVTTMLNFPRLVFGRLSTNLSNTIVYCLRVTFDDCFFNFFFFRHSLALGNDKQIVFLCQPIPRHTPHTQWLINSGGKYYIIFRN